MRGEQQHLPVQAARAGVDLVHSLASTGPAWGRFARTVTIHDLIYLVYPEAHPGVRTQGMRLLVPLAARSSQRVMAVSRSTADDLTLLLGIPREKIDVVPDGLGVSAEGIATPEAELRTAHGLGERQIALSVSAKRPHKNIARLLDALALIPAGRRPLLVVPGYQTWYEAELRALAHGLGLDDDVRFLGWVSPADLEGLYAASACFVFASLYEGFGMPVLEAMSRGVPVVCADRSALPEVVGDAAVLFDPEDPASIARAIERVLGDPALAAHLREAGLRRAAGFTWARTAQLTVASYERTLAEHRTSGRVVPRPTLRRKAIL